MKPKPRNKSVYSLEKPLQAAILSFKGLSRYGVYRAMKVDERTFKTWERKYPEMALAFDTGKEMAKIPEGSTDLKEYIIGHLSPQMRKVWDKIEFWSECVNSKRVQDILDGQSKHVRQSLWLHTYMAYGFNASEACRKLCMSRGTLAKWKLDSGFKSLMKEMVWHRNNFFETALISRVSAGDTQAIIFANKTINRKRGYGDVLNLDVKGSVSHEHTHIHAAFTLDQLDLPLEVRKQVLAAIRQKNTPEATKALELKGNSLENEAVDVQTTEVEDDDET